MRRILLLNLLANQDGRTVGFPKKFDSVPYLVSPSGEKTMLDRKTVEQAVLKCINKFNQTLNVDSIEYVAIKDQFPSVFVGACTGVIVEEEEIPSDESDECKANGRFELQSDHDLRRLSECISSKTLVLYNARRL